MILYEIDEVVACLERWRGDTPAISFDETWIVRRKEQQVIGVDIRGQFNRVIAVILAANDQNPDSASKSEVRKATLTEINNLRRWVMEVANVDDNRDTGPQPPD